MSTDELMAPDEVSLRSDLQGSGFLVGEVERRWRLLDPPGITFPNLMIDVGAAKRKDGATRFCLRFDCTGYPSAAPTAMLWDVESKSQLALDRYPKGGGDVAKVFRTDWPGAPEKPGSALYHPMDRRPLADHTDWPQAYRGQAWNSRRTIVDYVEMVYGLLNSPNYRGV